MSHTICTALGALCSTQYWYLQCRLISLFESNVSAPPIGPLLQGNNIYYNLGETIPAEEMQSVPRLATV